MTRNNTWLNIVTLATFVLGAADWVLAPQKATFLALGLGTMAAIWLVPRVLARVCSQSDNEKRSVTRSAILAGLMLAASFAMVLPIVPASESAVLHARGPGIIIALMMVVIGNAVPKAIRPLAERRAPGQRQALQRFTGWAFVLAGLIGLALWLGVAPDQANTVSMFVYAGALVLVIARWILASGRSASPQS